MVDRCGDLHARRSMGHPFFQVMIYGVIRWQPIEEQLGD
jgi:hypothetical protein